MTEAEWQQCQEPRKMLEALRPLLRNRKMRLFAVACCRRVWPLLKDERDRRRVEAAELAADGLANLREFGTTRARDARRTTDPAREAARAVSIPQPDQAAAEAATHAKVAAGMAAWLRLLGQAIADMDHARRAAFAAEQAAQADLLRCLFGGPPFSPSPLTPECLTPNVVTLARLVYDEHRFDDLPVLGDALEEAGCPVRAALDHCRRPGPHARGCWVVDAVLAQW